MGCGLAYIVEKLLQVFLVFEHVLVEVGHFSHTHDLAALLQKYRNAYVFSER